MKYLPGIIKHFHVVEFKFRNLFHFSADLRKSGQSGPWTQSWKGNGSPCPAEQTAGSWKCWRCGKGRGRGAGRGSSWSWGRGRWPGAGRSAWWGRGTPRVAAPAVRCWLWSGVTTCLCPPWADLACNDDYYYYYYERPGDSHPHLSGRGCSCAPLARGWGWPGHDQAPHPSPAGWGSPCPARTWWGRARGSRFCHRCCCCCCRRQGWPSAGSGAQSSGTWLGGFETRPTNLIWFKD